jgi:CYTH domain-containing protein/CHAD domain-containing protein
VAAEIERKFLIPAPPDRVRAGEGTQIEQAYLAITDEVEVRLRRSGSETRLTVKGGHGDVRQEIEFAVEAQEFEELWSLSADRRLEKTRLEVPLENGLVAEVDIFEGVLEGLVIAEVEFDSEDAKRDFEPPAWFGDELTGDQRYANQTMATDGSPDSGGRSTGSPFRLKQRESVADGTRRLACGRAEKALERLADSDADEDAVVHGVRKDLKKLRAVLRLVRAGLGESFYREQNERFRDAGRLLSDTRDGQVKLETLEALDERYGSELPDQPISLWRGILEGEQRQVAQEQDGDPGARLGEAKEMIAGGAEALGRWPVKGHGWSLVDSGLARTYREARKGIKRVRSSRSADDVHEWRKRTKDLWYQLRLLRGSWKPVIGELAEQAHELTNLLGDHHDLTVLAEDLDTRQAVRDRDQIGDLIADRQDELLNEALKLGSRLLAEKPNAFRRRFERYWRAWR